MALSEAPVLEGCEVEEVLKYFQTSAVSVAGLCISAAARLPGALGVSQIIQIHRHYSGFYQRNVRSTGGKYCKKIIASRENDTDYQTVLS